MTNGKDQSHELSACDWSFPCVDQSLAVLEKLQHFHQLFALRALAVVRGDIVIEDLLELLDDVVAAQGGRELAVDIDWGDGIFKGAG